MIDLIDLDRCRQNVPSSANTDEPVLSTLITAASRAIRKYCRRDFTQTTYDELYSGTGDRRLFLRQMPLLSVQSVRYRPVTVLKIINNLANTPQARVAVTSTGLTLTWVTSGVSSTRRISSGRWASATSEFNTPRVTPRFPRAFRKRVPSGCRKSTTRPTATRR